MRCGGTGGSESERCQKGAAVRSAALRRGGARKRGGPRPHGCGAIHAYPCVRVAPTEQHTHTLAAAPSHGKTVAPRIAALMDVQQISEISAVETPDTFVRPTYAGN